MINISDATKAKYQSGQCKKNIYISMPALGVSFDCSQILEDTLNITESVFDGNSLEFVGCICSTMQVEIMGDWDNSYSDTPIVVQMDLDEDETDTITLFRGYVINTENTLEIGKKKIVAYDELYYRASDCDVADWYNDLHFPITIKNLRDSLFSHIGISQMTQTLINDDVTIEKIYDPKELQAIAVIKHICQMNSVMGIMNRSGYFEYRTVAESVPPVSSTWPYPSLSVFPGSDKFPNHDETSGTTITVSDEDPELMSFYKSVTYEDYTTVNIEKVTVRDSEDDPEPVSYGPGYNRYVVQGNMFIRGLSQSDKADVASAIYNKVKNITYIPFKASVLGQPWLECGDIVRFYVVTMEHGTQQYEIKDFVIMNRTIKGCQNLEDSWEAKGTKNQRVFVSDIGTSVDLIAIQEEIDDINDVLDDHEDRIAALEEGGGSNFQIVSVQTVPSSPAANTLYLIQGEIVIL